MIAALLPQRLPPPCLGPMSFFSHHLEYDDWGNFWHLVGKLPPIDQDQAVAAARRLFDEIERLWNRHLG
jgi:hypothetical protein